MVARQGDRATGQLGHLTRSGNHPAVAQRASPVKGQHPAIGHVTRAQGSVGATITDLQHPTLDRGQATESVSPGQCHHVRPLLLQRARTRNHPAQRVVV